MRPFNICKIRNHVLASKRLLQRSCLFPSGLSKCTALYFGLCKPISGLYDCANLRIVRICSLNNKAQTQTDTNTTDSTDLDRLSCDCAGSLITKKHVLTSYYCVSHNCAPIDFSKGKDLVLSNPRAESARAVTGRRCPHSGVGEDFLGHRPGPLTKTGVTRERKVVD